MLIKELNLKESFIRQIIAKAIQRLGAVKFHPPDYAIAEEHTRPDILAWTPTGSAVIEVKDVPIRLYKVGPDKGLWSGIFPFREINDAQRAYADSLVESGNYHYIGIGPTGGRFSFREIIVVPWDIWRGMENDHPENTSIRWITIKSIFFDSYGLDKDESGYFFPAGHPICAHLTPEKPFIWLDKDNPKSRRFEKEIKNG